MGITDLLVNACTLYTLLLVCTCAAIWWIHLQRAYFAANLLFIIYYYYLLCCLFQLSERLWCPAEWIRRHQPGHTACYLWRTIFYQRHSTENRWEALRFIACECTLNINAYLLIDSMFLLQWKVLQYWYHFSFFYAASRANSIADCLCLSATIFLWFSQNLANILSSFWGR